VRHRPQRTCVGCRTVRDKGDLVRIVRTPDEHFLLDASGKLNGRGAYLCAAPDCLEKAVKRKSFDRAFRGSVPRDALGALQQSLEEYVRTVQRPVAEPEARADAVGGTTAG
jgi:predicted RNA-binding protein YlxR (DUF448 family)